MVPFSWPRESGQQHTLLLLSSSSPGVEDVRVDSLLFAERAWSVVTVELGKY